MQNPVTRVRLTLTPVQFAAVYGILYHTRMGTDSEYGEELTKLMIELEENGSEELFERVLKENLLPRPQLSVTANMDEGVTLEVY